ncbi:hypothetical protein ANO14919_084770 [Xylariales sp. No.14919]|nr:hypothetical protein ANO14919_084770 [Xylariales sp. No.14919]
MAPKPKVVWKLHCNRWTIAEVLEMVMAQSGKRWTAMRYPGDIRESQAEGGLMKHAER